MGGIMSKRKYTALVLGASGLVGYHTVKHLLENEQYDTVYAVSRKGLDLDHPKLKQIQAEYENIDNQIVDLKINHFFSALGSTKAKTPDPEDYYKVDYHYPLKVAKILKSNGCEQALLVSALGADASSRIFYSKLKGEVERDLIKIGFSGTHILRPSLIKGDRGERRIGEDIAVGLFKVADLFLVGPLKKYSSIKGEKIGSAMVNIADQNWEGVYIYTTDLIKRFA